MQQDARDLTSGPREGRDRAADVATIQALKERDNRTNFRHLALVYLVMAITVVGTAWSWSAVAAAGLGWWWNIPATLIAIVIMGGSQHQLGGAVHEAAHFMLFKSRLLNEIAGDWLCAFPIFSTTYQYRVQHLAHHQFVNDPARDPDISQLKESDHWLDFPMPQMDFVRAILSALIPTRLARFSIARARYGAFGFDGSPYHTPELRGSKWVTRLFLIFVVAVAILSGRLSRYGLTLWSLALIGSAWLALTATYLALPSRAFPATRLEPVISHRATMISRASYIALLLALVTGLHHVGLPGGNCFNLLWLVPLFTTFPLFMMLRQWVQHGNADRGRYTNSRVFLVNPLLRYCVFPWGQDYHLPHHLQASVPHYNLEKLHEVMLRDPEYREKASVLNGFLRPRHGGISVAEALSAEHAPKLTERAHVDSATLEYAELTNEAASAIRREAELSRGK